MPRHTRTPEARAWLATYGMRDAVVVPLNGATGIVGALVVADRLGDVRTFAEDDVLLLETVANHAGVALRNGELIGQLRHDSLHDALTGLPNRTDLQRRLTAALAAVADGSSPGTAILILDLDEFKQVNETLGHAQGDHLLREVALRLEGIVGTTGTVARLGSDEFAVLLPATGGRGAGPAPRPTHPPGPRATHRARRPRVRDRRLGRRRPRTGARDRHDDAAQAGRHGDVRRQDLDDPRCGCTTRSSTPTGRGA